MFCFVIVCSESLKEETQNNTQTQALLQTEVRELERKASAKVATNEQNQNLMNELKLAHEKIIELNTQKSQFMQQYRMMIESVYHEKKMLQTLSYTTVQFDFHACFCKI